MKNVFRSFLMIGLILTVGMVTACGDGDDDNGNGGGNNTSKSVDPKYTGKYYNGLFNYCTIDTDTILFYSSEGFSYSITPVWTTGEIIQLSPWIESNEGIYLYMIPFSHTPHMDSYGYFVEEDNKIKFVCPDGIFIKQ